MKKTIPIIFTICFFILGFTKNKNLPTLNCKLMSDTINTISGTFNSYYYTHINAFGGISKDSMSTVEFYPNAINNQTTTTVYAGKIYANSIEIPYDNSYLRYFQTTSNINMNIMNWTISGSNNISASSFSITPTFPTFNYINLPDTCTKSLGISITLNSLQNTDPNLFVSSATIQQANGSIKITKTINYSSISNNTVFFNQSDLAPFNTNNNLEIIISLQNFKYFTVGTENYTYITSHHFKKDSYLK